MNSLHEFARLNGPGEPPAPPPALPTYEERQEERQKIALLKKSIQEQLWSGNEPESILYSALYALGLATNDPDFLEQVSPFLNGDKEELNFFPDIEEMQAQREERRRKYYEKHMRDAEKQIKLLDADREALEKELEVIRKQLRQDKMQKLAEQWHEEQDT